MKNKIFLLTLIVALVCPLLAFANSAEPPALIIIVTDPQREVQVTVLGTKGEVQPQIRQVSWERHFQFYKLMLEPHKVQRILVKTPDKSFEVLTPYKIRDYHSVFTLDLSAQTLTEGTSPYRDGILVALRLLLTFLIEGALFYAFGFRDKSSWLAFIGINLLTQGFLNLWLSQSDNWDSYLILLLIFGEFFIFMAESILMLIFLKEKSRIRQLAYVWTSNFASLVLGGYLILNLPL